MLQIKIFKFRHFKVLTQIKCIHGVCAKLDSGRFLTMTPVKIKNISK